MKTVVVLAVSAGLALAADPDMPETFGDGSTPTNNGWAFNSGGAIADRGADGAGDHALVYTASNPAPLNNGYHVLHPIGDSTPNPVFIGDYLAAGITAIQFEARHTGLGSDLVLRATLFDTFGDGVDYVVSTAAVTIPATANTWQTYSIPIAPTDVFAGGANGRTAEDILGAVVQVGLRHDPTGNGPQSPSSVLSPTACDFDDIVLLGGPACFADLAPPGGDGVVNLDDLDAFVAFFLGSDLAADCDANGALNLDDLDCFVTSFLSGCP